jgi:NDP-sugar pyrophosphorylase family protein
MFPLPHPNIVVLAGGISSRMKNQSSQRGGIDPSLLQEATSACKAMLRVGRGSRPFLDYLLHTISRAGYENVVIVIGDHDDSIRSYYERNGASDQFKKLRMSYVVQPIPQGRSKPLGTADALLRALQSTPSWNGQSFTVCNSDNLYSYSALQLLLQDRHEHAMIDYDREALQFDQWRIAQFAVTKKDAEGFLQDIIEKPSPDQVHAATDARGRVGVSMNVFRFSSDMIMPYLEAVPMHPLRLERELPGAVKMMIAEHPRSLYAIPLSEHVIDLTSPSDIPIVQRHLATEFPDFLT